MLSAAIKSKILIVEDDSALQSAIAETLNLEGYPYVLASNGVEALNLLRDQRVDLVLTDVNMPEMDGLTLLRKIKEYNPMLPVLMMTAFGTVQKAVMAIKRGALDYIAKPFECVELIKKIEHYLDKTGCSDGEAIERPVVQDQVSMQLLTLARRVAQSNSSVLITGESGTGKEVLARYIHNESERDKDKFIAINCAAIPDNMLEAILFGHEKGAFTGAHQRTPGKFEQANGGTILLDEISEMDLSLQAKLLRVLQEREVERLGGKKTIKLDVRVLATTNRNLLDYVRAGKFREDLYYRLNVFPLKWSPLRHRIEDIIPLANHLLRKHSEAQQCGERYFDESALVKLRAHHWPGNVRELENVVQRSLVLSHGPVITEGEIFFEDPEWRALSDDAVGQREQKDREEDKGQEATHAFQVSDRFSEREALYEETTATPNDPNQTHTQRTDTHREVSLGEDLQNREFQVILNVLREVKGRRKTAAEKLGISPRTLRYKLARMRESGINLESV